MQNYDDKIEIIEAILGKVNAANETMGGLIYSDSKKIILDFTSSISLENHLAILEELKKEGAIENFESKNDCFYILYPSKSKLYEIKESLSLPTEQKSAAKPKELFFDANNGKIIWGTKDCKLPFKSIEYYVAEKVFEFPKDKIMEDDIITHIDLLSSKSDSPSRVVDARRRINKKAHQDLGIKNLIGYKNALYWLNSPE